MATTKIQTGLRLAEPLYERLKVISEAEHRSLNNLIEHVLERYVEVVENDKRQGLRCSTKG